MVDILLPTYNGEKYLSQQLDSIISQSYKDWRLIIRDDGSSDDTNTIIDRYKTEYVEKIIVISDGRGNLGPTKSFGVLMESVISDYFMFCDQDDIWEFNKIEISMKEMKKMEEKYHAEPILVCSDASCIDGSNNLLFRSFFESQRFSDTTSNVYKCLALNVVQGSTTLMNQKVREVIGTIPLGLYHDWWIAVNVAYYGHISYIHQPLLKYRQHQANVVGALNVGMTYLLKKLIHVKKQFTIYYVMYKSLPFKPSIIKWAYYKLVINIQRL